MKKTLLIFLLSTAVFISKAQTNTPDEKQAETTLKTFYTEYMSAFSGNGQSLKALREKYCTLKCQKQFARLAAATDGDPLIKGQDSDAGLAKTLAVSRNKSRPNAYTVSYQTPSYDNAGNMHQDTVTIQLLLVRQNGTYKVDTIL